MKTKVRFVTRKWAPTVGGMETYSVRLCDELAHLCDLEVIALPGRSETQVPSFLKMMLFGFYTVFKLLRGPAVDVTHIGDMASWPFAWIARKRYPADHVVISAHGSDITYADRVGVLSILYRMYLRLGSYAVGDLLVISNTKWLAGCAGNYGFENTTVVPLGTDFRKSPADIKGDHNSSIFFSGRVVKSKGLSFFLNEVLPLLPDSTIIRVAGTLGKDPGVDIANHPAVEFLGSLDMAELSDEYLNAMCVVVPSQAAEGFGLVAAEAACAGGVVVASAHSGLLEVCSNEIGFLVSASEPYQWVDIILKISAWSSDERVQFTQTSVAQACKRYDWKVTARNTFATYEL